MLSFIEFKLLMLYKNAVNSSESAHKRNWVKSCIQTTYPIDFGIMFSHFYSIFDFVAIFIYGKIEFSIL